MAAAHPAVPLPWAVLAEDSLAAGAPVAAYAYARTGYHRGLDALRRSGWKGHGPVPWEHEPNQGFLRALTRSARRPRRSARTTRPSAAAQFLADSSATAYGQLRPRSG